MNSSMQNYESVIDLVLSYHKGDIRAAIESLLKDREFLIEEVEYANFAVTHGQRDSSFKRAA